MNKENNKCQLKRVCTSFFLVLMQQFTGEHFFFFPDGFLIWTDVSERVSERASE